MDPVSALVLAFWVAAYLVRNVYQDSVYKARGEDPPSYRRQQERARRRTERADRFRELVGDDGATRFWAHVWRDAWLSADERRQHRLGKRLDRRRAGWAEDDAYEINDRIPPEPAPLPEPQARPAPRPEPEARPEAGWPPGWDLPEPAGGEDGWTHAPRGVCEICDARVDPATIVTRWADNRSHVLEVCPRCASLIDAPPPQPQPQLTADDSTAGGAKIIPFLPPIPIDTNATNQEDPMAETYSLNSALAWTTTMAANADEAVASTETSLASVQSGGVSGGAVAALQSAMEAMAAAASAYRTANAELQKHLMVQEAYAANAGAGTREFVQAD